MKPKSTNPENINDVGCLRSPCDDSPSYMDEFGASKGNSEITAEDARFLVKSLTKEMETFFTNSDRKSRIETAHMISDLCAQIYCWAGYHSVLIFQEMHDEFAAVRSAIEDLQEE